MKALTAWSSHLGNRSSNQDRCLVLEKPGRMLLAVADGMGGHARGDLAAEVAVQSLRRTFLAETGSIPEPRVFLKAALQKAHREVVCAGRSEHPPITPRTTCVVCLVQVDQAWWAHVGDSRLYLLRSGTLVARTRDHTPVEELLQSGVIREDELRSHPLRNSVSRCLGGMARPPDISSDQARLKPDDILLLCSDGLWSALPDQKLLAIPGYGDLDRSVRQLTAEAEAASYPQSDNISVVCLRWLSAGKPATTATDPATSRRKTEKKTTDPVQQAKDDIHRAMLDYAAEMKK
ncbi:MAG: protein phosphatase 2C domain-containing protein [Thiogranum sp.]|nr:protein phosphatase 2C domain-containing protein [Thiogranum sp.]